LKPVVSEPELNMQSIVIAQTLDFYYIFLFDKVSLFLTPLAIELTFLIICIYRHYKVLHAVRVQKPTQIPDFKNSP